MTRREFLAKSSLAISSLYIPSSLVSKENDIYISSKEIQSFLSVRHKLNLLKKHVGYGKFNIISFDYLLKVLKYSTIKNFTQNELSFIEKIYYEDVKDYKFYGNKTSISLTEKIKIQDVVKIDHSGHYLFKGESKNKYDQILKDVPGNSLILTSGVRSIVKQMNLYLNKIYSTHYNITKASFSIAPPSYSYHTISDFDIGKKGWGHANFTKRFALTEEFQYLQKLEYIQLRYNTDNKDGVRFEPWHVEVQT